MKTSPLVTTAAFLAVVVAVIFLARLADNDGPGQLERDNKLKVIDGDTVQYGNVIYRLVGYDSPERGDRALCDKERELGEIAAGRLASLVASGSASIEPIACACPPATEGTQQCNSGRSCAYLKVGGHDVGPILISEGLARTFVCNAISCPPRGSWC